MATAETTAKETKSTKREKVDYLEFKGIEPGSLDATPDDFFSPPDGVRFAKLDAVAFSDDTLFYQHEVSVHKRALESAEESLKAMHTRIEKVRNRLADAENMVALADQHKDKESLELAAQIASLTARLEKRKEQLGEDGESS